MSAESSRAVTLGDLISSMHTYNGFAYIMYVRRRRRRRHKNYDCRIFIIVEFLYSNNEKRSLIKQSKNTAAKSTAKKAQNSTSIFLTQSTERQGELNRLQCRHLEALKSIAPKEYRSAKGHGI